MVIQMYTELESKFKINYPLNNNATYTSLLNYSKNLDTPFQRWYRYKEGYSIELVDYLIKEYCKNPNGIILDPFLGSGTTILGARKNNMNSIGYEVNPFSCFLSKAKTDKYSKKDLNEFKKTYINIISNAKTMKVNYELPKLSFSNKVFDKHIETYLMTVKYLIDEVDSRKTYKNLLLIGWLSSIEKFSNYKKSGNGLKIRKTKKPIVISIDEVFKYLEEEYNNIYIDLNSENNNVKCNIYNKSSLTMRDDLKRNSITGIIFSPPYANCFDYTEIYKLELWFGNFVNEYNDLKELRTKSLRSHLNSSLEDNDDSINKSEILKRLIEQLSEKEVWDKKIPIMLKNYFSDMFKIIDDSFYLLEKDGFCNIIVGNSAYGGIVFPTDLILSEYAKSIGFKVDKIDVYRYIIPSSQQYKDTLENKKYLRESVICLIKK